MYYLDMHAKSVVIDHFSFNISMLCVRESVMEEYSCISSVRVYLLRKSIYMHV